MNKLITAVLTRGEGGWLGRVNPLLLSEHEKQHVLWVKEYVLKYGAMPTLERFCDEFKFFVPVKSADPCADIFDRLVVDKRNVFFKQFINTHHKEINDGADPAEMIDRLIKAMTMQNGLLASISEYDRTVYFTAINSIRYGIDLIDEATGGLVGGDLAWIVGRPGSGKTTLMDWMITNWSLQGRKILYISNENSSQNVVPKLDSIFAGWNPIKHRTRSWDDVDKLKIKLIQHILMSLGVEIIVPEAPALSTAAVAALIDEVKPDIVAIDGVYLMSEASNAGQRDWKDAAAVSSNLKRLARKTGIPIIGVIQANKEAEGANVTRGSIAHTDAYLQDADAVISINMVDGKSSGQVIKSRWGSFSFADFFDYSTNFENMLITVTRKSGEIVDVGEDW
jgi:KaiC/GvpD/RAD55 family RecA-like ATPase